MHYNKNNFPSSNDTNTNKDNYVLLWSDYWHTNIYETRTEIIFKNTAS